MELYTTFLHTNSGEVFHYGVFTTLEKAKKVVKEAYEDYYADKEDDVTEYSDSDYDWTMVVTTKTEEGWEMVDTYFVFPIEVDKIIGEQI